MFGEFALRVNTRAGVVQVFSVPADLWYLSWREESNQKPSSSVAFLWVLPFLVEGRLVRCCQPDRKLCRRLLTSFCPPQSKYTDLNLTFAKVQLNKWRQNHAPPIELHIKVAEWGFQCQEIDSVKILRHRLFTQRYSSSATLNLSF